MLTLMASVGGLYYAWRQPGSALAVLAAFVVAALAALALLVVLDVLQRRDLDARQRAAWIALALLSPVGPGAYYVLRRRIGHAEPPPRERPPSAYRVHDPFHRH
jgi:drug/metabolite transporter (DMT)-like permease